MWYGAVVRGDKSKVKIGVGSAIKDRAIVDTVASLSSGYPTDVDIGRHCTVGAGAVVTSSVLKDGVQVGTGAIVCEGCVIETHSILAAGSVLPAGTLIPAYQFWAGNPAVYQRDVDDEEAGQAAKNAEVAAAAASRHADELLPHGFAYVEAEKAGHNA